MTEPTDSPLLALQEAIGKTDGVSDFARRIERNQSTVSMWLARALDTSGWKVPADACPAIERETGVPCERLHPGAAWEVLRMQAGPEPERRAA